VFRARRAAPNRIVNLIEEGIDVGVRIGHLADSGLTATRVGSVRRVVCAAPSYLRIDRVADEPGMDAHRGAPLGPEPPFRQGTGV
jgi:DNA-binding transcriptional LysR family regulator